MAFSPIEIMGAIEGAIRIKRCNVICDIGTSSAFSLKHLPIDPPSRYHCPLHYACCGIGIPMALGAGLGSDSSTLAIVGDAAALSRLGSLHSAVELSLRHWVVVVVNNGSNLMCEQGLGAEFPSVPTMQVGKFKARVDFATIAVGLGLDGRKVARACELVDQLPSALAADHPVLFDCESDPKIQADIRQRILQLTAEGR